MVDDDDEPLTVMNKDSESNSVFTLERRLKKSVLKQWEGKSLLCKYSQTDHKDDIIHEDTIEAVIVAVRSKYDPHIDRWMTWTTAGGIVLLLNISLLVIWVGVRCARGEGGSEDADGGDYERGF